MTTMTSSSTRRRFLQEVAGYGAAAAGLPLAGLSPCAGREAPRVPDHTLTVIAGKPRERGRLYGRNFKDAIHAFLDKEIYQACAPFASRDRLLRYAGQCTRAVRDYSPTIA